MSRRRVAALTALIVAPVVVVAIVLASVLGGDDSGQKPSPTTEPAQTAPAPGGGGSAAPAAPAPPATGTGGAKVPAGSLPLLGSGAPPKQLSDKLKPASNGTITLGKLRGSPVVLNIWSSDCTPCRADTRVLESEWERLGPRGVVFLGLNVLDSPSAARRFRSDYDVTYPSVAEQRAETAKQLGARGVPETFFLSKSGKIVAHVIGAVSLAQIELGVRAAQTGHAMPTDQGGGQIPLK
jgi:cytochrome c biogenesis protein CcmG/thiol:disulfide interchange protein DsbE